MAMAAITNSPAVIIRRLGYILVIACSACSVGSALTTSFLDPQTAVTVTTSKTPLILYRENPSVAAYARNFIHLGPIEVNQSGSYRYFLWLGIWNTMETPLVTEQRDGFEAITIFADGEPLFFEIAGWTSGAIGTSAPAYLKPVASAADAYYMVSIDQIRLIATANDIRLRTAGPSPREYRLWDDQRTARQSFGAFVAASDF